MRAALDQARLGLAAGEVPIGAIDPTAHAEVLVLRDAAHATGNYRLTDASVYVTLEPCVMCVGALIHARVREVVYAALEPKTGALVSTARLLDIPQLNHRFSTTGGVLEEEARGLIQQFFRDRRRAGKADRPVDPDLQIPASRPAP